MTVHLERELERLRRHIVSVGTKVEEAIDRAVESMVSRNESQALSVIEIDAEIDRIEVEVEEECLKLLALYQPVAGDLRFIISVLKINNDLERIGDYAVNIAKGARLMIAQDPIPIPPDIGEMATRARSMVTRSLDALVNADVSIAHQVCADDDEVDHLRSKLAEQIKRDIRQSPESIEPLMTLFMATGTLERIADMATNIAEDVCYMIEGRIIRHGMAKQVDGDAEDV
jgi:phosphate transport system protein